MPKKTPADRAPAGQTPASQAAPNAGARPRRKSVVIYTDGACQGNPGPGGYAALLTSGRHERVLAGAHPHTTNNQMELLAVIVALEALSGPCDVTLFVDSQYVIKGATQWIHGWRKKGWRTAGGKPVKNRPFWERLDRAATRDFSGARHALDWQWVRGHTGVEGNERVDQLANEAIRALQAGRATPVVLPGEAGEPPHADRGRPPKTRERA